MTKYAAFLRGINVGGNKRVEMKKLKALFEELGYANVLTYINSGNIIFESQDKRENIFDKIRVNLRKTFGFDISVLVKTKQEMQEIMKAIPLEWQNDSEQRSDVAYLFDEIDSEKIINELPINKEYVDMRYAKGVVFWNINRKNYNKSHLNKLISCKAYRFMTVRNVNTARKMLELMEDKK